MNRIALVEAYSKAQGMWREDGIADPVFTDMLELDLGDVVGAIDKLFANRFDALINSMQLGRPPRGPGGSAGGHGGPRKPRHLH